MSNPATIFAPYEADDVAYAFVQKGIIESNFVTQMKLQKILYFAHGLHLAQYHAPLIKETFQAWKFGPVIPRIYHTYKLYGSMPITNTDIAYLVDRPAPHFNDEANEIIEVTWKTLKNIDGIKLSQWTHQDDSPWKKHYEEQVLSKEIPNEEIERYFAEKFIKK
jgi:uncharacterized phage-associated protein